MLHLQQISLKLLMVDVWKEQEKLNANSLSKKVSRLVINHSKIYSCCFFSYTRATGHENTHPTPVDLKYHIRNYILEKHSAAVFSEQQNTKDRVEEMCLISGTASTSQENTIAASKEDSHELSQGVGNYKQLIEYKRIC
ncbi:hypothetical protein PR048_010738 [Dryococelus australis]|uniref:Uncharacterized protein n=1 Tax=Dryococelus australis TaxID=614101 RepID=A0ABQ9I3J5_9NEOP|nr:hypothetical protein PR048_010738 [Dryococelus australis]